jgi:hypothetical protein
MSDVSEVVEKQALKALLLEDRRRVLPEVGLAVRRVLTQASVTVGTNLRRLVRSVTAPSGGEEVELSPAIGTADEVTDETVCRHRRGALPLRTMTTATANWQSK